MDHVKILLIKNKKATITPINKKDNRYSQYGVTFPLNYKEKGKNTERITKLKPFINSYNLEGINFPSEKNNWKKFEKNNVTITFNVLYAKEEKIYPAYVSKHDSNREKQVILLMIPGEGPKDAKLSLKDAKVSPTGNNEDGIILQ